MVDTLYCGAEYRRGTLRAYGETNSHHPDGVAVPEVQLQVDSQVRHPTDYLSVVQKPLLEPPPSRTERRQEDQGVKLTAKIECACGCGSLLTPLDNKGRPRRFLHGHWIRTPKGQSQVTGAPHPSLRGKWLRQSDHWRTSRYRARTTTTHDSCAWHSISGCGGRIEVAHVDGNYTNNAPENLLPLCKSHHQLLDHGRINPKAPVMPPFYMSGGKRRYFKE